MTTIRAHWITALTIFAAAALGLLGIGVLFGDDGIEAWRVAYTTASLLGAAAILGGLWRMRAGAASGWVANALVVLGSAVLAVGYWWFVLVPPVVAAVVVYAGVIRHGLERELRPA